jgi:hypothetical protein
MRKGQPFGVKLLGQCIPSKDSPNREERTRLLASKRLGARLGGMVNTSKLPINVVTPRGAKDADRLYPKREVIWKYAVKSYFANDTSPANRQDLTHLWSHKRNTVSLYFFLQRKVNRKGI